MRSSTFVVGTEAAERAETSCQHLCDSAWKTGWLLHWARENISRSRAWLTALLFMINSRKLKDPVIVISGLSGKGEISDARRDIKHAGNKSYSWNHPLSSKHVRISNSTLLLPCSHLKCPWSVPWQDTMKWTPLEIMGMHPQSFLHHHWVLFTTQFAGFPASELWSRALLTPEEFTWVHCSNCVLSSLSLTKTGTQRCPTVLCLVCSVLELYPATSDRWLLESELGCLLPPSNSLNPFVLVIRASFFKVLQSFSNVYLRAYLL